MGTLKDTLRADRIVFMKNGDKLEKDTLGLVLSGIGTAEKQGQVASEFTDEQTLAFLATEVKKRRETAKTYASAGVVDRSERETAEAEFLASYLPVQLTEAELVDIVSTVVASNEGATVGAIMGKVMGQVKGKADGNTVRQLVQKVLAG